MDEAEAFSIANRARVRKRWAKTSAEKRRVHGRRMIKARAPVVTEPRSQDTRITQVFGPMTPEVITEAQRLGTYERVAKLMAKPEEGWPTSYYGREFQRALLTLQDYAKQFDDEGQREKAVQIQLVVMKHLKDLAKETPSPAFSSEEEARMRAEVEAMSDEELGYELGRKD
jgi:hypothetical protein